MAIEYFTTKDHHNAVKTNDEFISAYLFNGFIHVEKTEEKNINIHTLCLFSPKTIKNFGLSTDKKYLILELKNQEEI